MATPWQGRIERRLAGILAADVAGYSQLMGADEAGTARVLREHRAAVDPIVSGHGGPRAIQVSLTRAGPWTRSRPLTRVVFGTAKEHNAEHGRTSSKHQDQSPAYKGRERMARNGHLAERPS